jgi:hypothetical protein
LRLTDVDQLDLPLAAGRARGYAFAWPAKRPTSSTTTE